MVRDTRNQKKQTVKALFYTSGDTFASRIPATVARTGAHLAAAASQVETGN